MAESDKLLTESGVHGVGSILNPKPIIKDVSDIDPIALEQIAQYMEQRGLAIPIYQTTGFVQYAAQVSEVADLESTTSGFYTSLTTDGPKLTGLPPGKYAILFGAAISVGGSGAYMSAGNSGSDSFSCFQGAAGKVSVSRAGIKKLSSASNTIDTFYRSATGGESNSFSQRWLVAIKVANA